MGGGVKRLKEQSRFLFIHLVDEYNQELRDRVRILYKSLDVLHGVSNVNEPFEIQITRNLLH